MKVKECMCNDVCCVKPQTTVTEVAKLMGQYHIGSIPVCDENNCLCGIVTDRDILLRTVACNKNASTTQISEVMTTNVCQCNQDDEMSQAQNKMSQQQIRRLPVCDEQNHVIGILTLGNLCQNEQQIGTQQVCQTLGNICDCNQNAQNAQ